MQIGKRLVPDVQTGDLGVSPTTGHHQDITGCAIPRADESTDEIDDDQCSQHRKNDEEDLVDEIGAVDIGRLVVIFGDAFQSGQVDQAAGAHARPHHGHDAGNHGRIRIGKPVLRFGQKIEEPAGYGAQAGAELLCGREENWGRQRRGCEKKQQTGHGETARGQVHLVHSDAGGKSQAQRQHSDSEPNECNGRNVQHQSIEGAALRGLVELLPQQYGDQAGDDRGQVVDYAEENLAAGHFLEKYSQSDRRQKSQTDH